MCNVAGCIKADLGDNGDAHEAKADVEMKDGAAPPKIDYASSSSSGSEESDCGAPVVKARQTTGKRPGSQMHGATVVSEPNYLKV